MTIKLVRLAVLAGLASFSTGCATLFAGSTKTVLVSSHPDGAEVLVEGQMRGVTPLGLQFSGMTKDVRLTLRKPGYRDHHLLATRRFETIAILNCVNVVCWGVDILTGAMWRFDPPEVMVNLQPEAATFAPGSPPPPARDDFEPPPPPPPER